MATRRVFWSSLTTLVLLAIALRLHTIWLPLVAQNLVVDDALAPADVIAVFAAEEDRGKHAADLYRRGLAARVLTTGELISMAVYRTCGERITGAGLMAKILLDEGIPKDVVVALPRGTSTYEEAQAMKSFMTGNGYHSLIAVSSPYHMRRVRASLSRVLEGSGITVRYSPARSDGFNVFEWWRDERDFLSVTNEYIKLAYYHLALF